MKIAIDCRFWGPHHTGLGRYSQSLVTQIYKLKPQYQFYLLINPQDHQKIKKSVPGFNLIKCQSKPYSVSEQVEVIKILKKIKPDLTHFLHFNCPYFYNQKFIVTIHDLIKHHSTGLQTTTKSALTYPLRRLAYFKVMDHAIDKSQKIITPSKWVKKDILKHYQIKPSKITITPEAPAKIYTTPLISRQKPLKQPYLIFVGNAYPHKHLIQLIKVIQKLNQELKKPLLLVIVTGRGVFYQRLRQQIKDLKAQPFIRLKNFASDKELKKLYFHSLAFITTSLLEGFGLPGLEAMAAGTLVLASNCSSLPEVYQNHALYFNPQNQTEMISQIKKVLRLSASKKSLMIRKNQQFVKKYSWQKTAQQTLSVYQSL